MCFAVLCTVAGAAPAGGGGGHQGSVSVLHSDEIGLPGVRVPQVAHGEGRGRGQVARLCGPFPASPAAQARAHGQVERQGDILDPGPVCWESAM